MLGKKLRRTSLTKEQKEKIQKQLDKIPRVKTNRPTENEPADLFEVNRKEGVDEYLFQGDMVLTENQIDILELQLADIDDPKRAKRQAYTLAQKWTNNTVYYYIDPSINERKKTSMAAALGYLQSHTCINFIGNSTAPNRIWVFNGDGCYSALGMRGGVQPLSLGQGCEVIGTVAHEFTHALGIFHSQMRSDRDEYVTIDLSNVDEDLHGQFAKLQTLESINYTPYEFGGFMHYGANAFVETPGKLSIIPKDIRYAYTMGNRQISFYDIQMVNDHYGCTAKCAVTTSAQFKNGGTPNPRNCATCNCPLGYGGRFCDERPSGCGDVLEATSEWKSQELKVGNNIYDISDIFNMCNFWINAPVEHKIQVNITSMFNYDCSYGCPWNGIEIKADKDQKMTNPRFCCPELTGQVITSELNPTPVIGFNRFYNSKFTFEYRYITVDPPTTTVPTTITTKAPVRNCANMNSGTNCEKIVSAGLCSAPSPYNFQTIKYNCGKSCGLCGKTAATCVDTSSECGEFKAGGYCESMKPMEAEYHCAKTCGFCEKPN